ncbi:DUF4158 domain-containing protein [Streptomyces sp. NBC_00059]|uniref:DUF4158 domain-containing protein n=1 Tax=Streptomyces sp. NBC_00059 TaxID=2975635 RepID=UPI00338D9491
MLVDDDCDPVALGRSTHHQLGFALQMCTVRHIGRFPPAVCRLRPAGSRSGTEAVV